MRRFEFSAGTSNKFWAVAASKAVLTIRFGKLGATGQTQLKAFASPAAAKTAMAALIAAKVKTGYVEASAKAPAKALVLAKSGIKPGDLVVKRLRANPGAVHRIVMLDHRAVATGASCHVTTDGKTFTRGPRPGESYGLFAIDGVLYSCGTAFARSRDHGVTWERIKLPFSGFTFAIHRDARGIWWLGGYLGVVLTSKRPDKGWKRASFTGPGKILAITEVDGALFFAGAGTGVWNGKTYKPVKGLTRSDVVTRLVETPSGALVAIGDGGIAFRSEDRGKSFTRVKSGVTVDLEDLAWIAGALFVVGGRGTLLRSTTDGKSYTKVTTGLTAKIWTIASWGDGGFLGGDGDLCTFAAPGDPYWKPGRRA